MLKNGLLVLLTMFVMLSFAQKKEKKSDIKTVTYSCNLHCHSCQEKVEHNIAFEKGVKAITADVESQTVTVTYKTKKNTKEGIQKAIKDLGYKVEVIEPKKTTEKKKK